MTWTWVSVGSGNASTVRSRKASQPQIATTAVSARIAALFFSEKSTRCWNTSMLQGELVEEQDRALAHVAAAGLEPAPELHLSAPLPPGSDGHPLQLPLSARDEDHRTLPVGDHRLGRDADPLLRRIGLDLHVDEGVGAKHAVGVCGADPQLDGAALGVDHLGDAVDGAGTDHSARAGADGDVAADVEIVS